MRKAQIVVIKDVLIIPGRGYLVEVDAPVPLGSVLSTRNECCWHVIGVEGNRLMLRSGQNAAGGWADPTNLHPGATLAEVVV